MGDVTKSDRVVGMLPSRTGQLGMLPSRTG